MEGVGLSVGGWVVGGERGEREERRRGVGAWWWFRQLRTRRVCPGSSLRAMRTRSRHLVARRLSCGNRCLESDRSCPETVEARHGPR